MCNSVLQGHVQSGVVVTPIILYSDKTKITHDQRRSLWPVSLSIANIDRQLRGKPHGNVWLGTLPAEIGDASESEEYFDRLQTFQECFSRVVRSLKDACVG